MPKFVHWITGKTKNKSGYQPSAYANGYGLKGHSGKRGNQQSNPTVSNVTSPWMDSEEHEISLMGKSKGNYHNLEVGRNHYTEPASVSTVEPVERANGVVPDNRIWKTNTVKVDSSLDPERGGHDFL